MNNKVVAYQPQVTLNETEAALKKISAGYFCIDGEWYEIEQIANNFAEDMGFELPNGVLLSNAEMRSCLRENGYRVSPGGRSLVFDNNLFLASQKHIKTAVMSNNQLDIPFQDDIFIGIGSKYQHSRIRFCLSKFDAKNEGSPVLRQNIIGGKEQEYKLEFNIPYVIGRNMQGRHVFLPEECKYICVDEDNISRDKHFLLMLSRDGDEIVVNIIDYGSKNSLFVSTSQFTDSGEDFEILREQLTWYAKAPNGANEYNDPPKGTDPVKHFISVIDNIVRIYRKSSRYPTLVDLRKAVLKENLIANLPGTFEDNQQYNTNQSRERREICLDRMMRMVNDKDYNIMEPAFEIVNQYFRYFTRRYKDFESLLVSEALPRTSPEQYRLLRANMAKVAGDEASRLETHDQDHLKKQTLALTQLIQPLPEGYEDKKPKIKWVIRQPKKHL